MNKTRIKIVGIDCPTCFYAIEKRLRSLGCIRSFVTDVSTGVSEIEYDESICTLKEIFEAVRDSGYDVYKEKLYFSLKEFHGEEALTLESKIQRLRGILDARISPVSGVAVVMFNPMDVTREEVINQLKAFNAELLTEITSKTRISARTLLYRRLGSFAIGLAAITLSMYTMFSGQVHFITREFEVMLLLMSILAITLNYDIILRGFRSLIAATPIMDSLISISSISAMIAGIASVAGLLDLHGSGFHPSSFFEASAGVIGFVGFGKYLEERLRRRTSKILENLAMSLRGNARVVSNGSIVEKPIAEVKPGDLVEVKAGEIIPVDGVVIEGSGYVDESSFTGEPTPRIKKGESRDSVLAGSILQSGYLKVRATRVGSETLIAYIIDMVRESESLKPRLVRLADRIVGYFTWIVLAIAITTLIYWWFVYGNVQLAVMFMAAVLAAACPCGLGIAIPLVVSAAVLKSSRYGILIRAGDVFERMLNIDLILFDKTGTITVGKPKLLAIHNLESIDTRSMLHLICSIESRSEHPLAQAIIEKCRSENVNISDPSEYIHFPGEGIFGVVSGVQVAVGNLELASRLDAHVDEHVFRIIEEIGSRGNTPILVVIGEKVAAILEIGDKIREETFQVIDALKEKGYKVGLASGDVKTSVAYYKELLKPDLTYWELKPNDKASLIRDLQRKALKVAFVGDGINDAPALSVADVGVAMGSGADISKEAGEIVIMNNNLMSLIFLLEFSKIVKRKMLQNLFWAFIYNITLIPIAAGVFYIPLQIFITPELAAVAMILSDISVIANALSILKPGDWKKK